MMNNSLKKTNTGNIERNLRRETEEGSFSRTDRQAIDVVYTEWNTNYIKQHWKPGWRTDYTGTRETHIKPFTHTGKKSRGILVTHQSKREKDIRYLDLYNLQYNH